MKNLYNLTVPLRDGITLAADRYGPAGDAPAPAIVLGTPYGKNDPRRPAQAALMAERGYAVLIYDVRGRGDSDGVFEPYRNEGRDGYDVIEWVAAQDWCDGSVASWGGSYSGHAQWLTALEKPPHLRAIVAYATPSDPFVDFPTGTRLPQEVCWYRMVDRRALQNVTGIDWNAVYSHLPLYTMDEAAGFVSAAWRADIGHAPGDTEYWAPLAYQQKLSVVDVPALHITGWYDDVQPGTLRNFAAMVSKAPTEKARRAQRLVMGPWGHDAGRAGGRKIGDVDFGDHAEDVEVTEFELRFLDHHLRGIDNGVDREARARLFLMGRGEWRDADEWPLPETVWTSLYLRSAGDANTRGGGGRLTTDAPASEEPTDTYRYDPADPVPFLTEPTSMQIGGPDDYAEVEDRDDVLVYLGPELGEPLTVIGPVRAELFVGSDAPDTDFTAKLVDVAPDGVRRRLCDGIVRARYREGFATERTLRPGVVYRVEVDMWSTAHEFSVGHRVGLEISSSAFPKYDRNQNTGGSIVHGTEPRVAHNEIWHGPERPSRLILPVIPGLDPV
ncbi:CocE/NonD family hydrolase [Nonomuraea sp. NPDC059007]|uniref:CocE/NonD family hydrolase n=1 Tax=Nonomuraea sp. NPDC059007 TaxID=3346692 RepID=UPI0036C7E7AC